jgi:uncharacterized alkaline shock family protein YloU
MTQYLIATSVLESIVRGSLENDERVRVHTPLPLVRTHPIDIAVNGEQCFVAIQLDARMGENLPSLATGVRRTVADALGSMTGLKVAAVDVSFNGVFPVGL